MEEKNKSKNAAGVVIIFIIGVLIIALICCVIYTKNLKTLLEASSVKIENLEREQQESDKENKIIEITEINSIIKKLNIIDGLKFSSVSELSNDKIYTSVMYYLYNNNENIENITEKQIKETIKDVFNVEYKGDFEDKEFGEGDLGRYSNISKIEKKDKYYKVYYSLMQISQADEPDSVSGTYIAEIGITESGDLYIKSNKEEK